MRVYSFYHSVTIIFRWAFGVGVLGNSDAPESDERLFFACPESHKKYEAILLRESKGNQNTKTIIPGMMKVSGFFILKSLVHGVRLCFF